MNADHRHGAPRVLVVDDEDAVRRLMARILERAGLVAEQADGGAEALSRLEAEAFDLVLLDLMMPGVDGLEVLRTIRRTKPAHELPVIVATARNDPADLVGALSEGANDYVTKPFDSEVLVARIQARLQIDRRPARRSTELPLLDERYVLEELIGRGGESEVYRGRHVALEKPVAIKVIRLAEDDPQRLARLRQEGMAACRVDHPHAVDVLDFGATSDGNAFLVMELLEGRDLGQELRRASRLSLGRAADVLMPVAAVLAEAHGGGLLHRDVKPGNIFLHQDPRGERVKLLDFGVARLLGYSRETTRGGIVGTLSYLAPERLLYRPHDGRSDVYSLATVLYELLTGAPPFDTRRHDEDAVAAMQVHQPPPSLHDVLPEVPSRIDALVMAGLAKDPAERPTASAFGLELGMITRLHI